ncbi:Oligopeptide transporter, OPT superfamily [Dillenia turbinata]|uniref:Oligopeptide transporter, OPT superfamily n=1 Tax=Dillenia turbinata TaxID=194707 RepID=A0AAN8VIW4_9MAGN
MFQWFFSAADGCGFNSFPTFSLKAYDHEFYFDFLATFLGVGMICPYVINISLLVGAVFSWGVIWPPIGTKKGVWYDADLKASSLHDLQGYKVKEKRVKFLKFLKLLKFLKFLKLLKFLKFLKFNIDNPGFETPDSEYQVLYALVYRNVYLLRMQRFSSMPKSCPLLCLAFFAGATGQTLIGLYLQLSNKDHVLPVADKPDFSEETKETLSYDDQIRTKLFLKDQIPNWAPISGYVGINNYILVIYIVTPMLAFCNAYGCGLTDWSLTSTCRKLAIFIIGAWAGAAHGGVLAGLVACRVMMNIISTASDLMQDFKTG